MITQEVLGESQEQNKLLRFYTIFNMLAFLLQAITITVIGVKFQFGS